jgi:hypothetical protein
MSFGSGKAAVGIVRVGAQVALVSPSVPIKTVRATFLNCFRDISPPLVENECRACGTKVLYGVVRRRIGCHDALERMLASSDRLVKISCQDVPPNLTTRNASFRFL